MGGCGAPLPLAMVPCVSRVSIATYDVPQPKPPSAGSEVSHPWKWEFLPEITTNRQRLSGASATGRGRAVGGFGAAGRRGLAPAHRAYARPPSAWRELGRRVPGRALSPRAIAPTAASAAAGRLAAGGTLSPRAMPKVGRQPSSIALPEPLGGSLTVHPAGADSRYVGPDVVAEYSSNSHTASGRLPATTRAASTRPRYSSTVSSLVHETRVRGGSRRIMIASNGQWGGM